MPIFPLPQFEADVKEQLAEDDRKAYEALKAPKTLVVRFGSMKLIGEFQYQGAVKPGCGSKVVVKTFRGTELGEMLTSTCPNSGCNKSVSRKEMLDYIDNSGGGDYPFYTEGRVLRIATGEDMQRQSGLEQSKHELKMKAKTVASRLNIRAKIVEVEPVLGGESVTVFYSIEQPPAEGDGGDGGDRGLAVMGGRPPNPDQQQALRVEMRDLVRELGQVLRTHIEVRPIGARDEARLTADYEKCGQYCCCKNFLKVLKPVTMKSAKVQKATLDPLKISGRCGRLMCCLRYEDNTYDELSKRLPRKKSRVGTPEGDGLVLDTQILTQLALVLLDAPGADGKIRQVAVAVEDLSPVKDAKGPTEPVQDRIRAAQDAARADRKRPSGPSAMGAAISPRVGSTPPAEGVDRQPEERGEAGTKEPPRQPQAQPPRERAQPQGERRGEKPEARKDQRQDQRQDSASQPAGGSRPRIHQRGGPGNRPAGPQIADGQAQGGGALPPRTQQGRQQDGQTDGRPDGRKGPRANQGNQPMRGPAQGGPQGGRPPQGNRPRTKEDEINEIMGEVMGDTGAAPRGERPRDDRPRDDRPRDDRPRGNPPGGNNSRGNRGPQRDDRPRGERRDGREPGDGRSEDGKKDERRDEPPVS